MKDNEGWLPIQEKPDRRGFQDLEGMTFGRWTAVSYGGMDKHHGSFFNCECECGARKHVRASSLLAGGSKSCGCLGRELLSEARGSHRQTGTVEYNTWLRIKSRCYNPKNPSYQHYGDKGIEVCDRWRDSFDNFFVDMGERPPGDYSIDRIDNDGDYTPENCRWATAEQQAGNKSTNVLLEIDGETKILGQWCREFGIGEPTVRQRMKRGMTAKDAFTRPIGWKESWIAFGSTEMTPNEWCSLFGVPHTTYLKRARNGWDRRLALLVPPGRVPRKHRLVMKDGIAVCEPIKKQGRASK